MSRKRSPAQDDTANTVWVVAERTPLGAGYMMVISYDDDHVLTLSGPDVGAYCLTLVEAITRAQYAEGVRRQFESVKGIDEVDAVVMTQSLRDDWPDLPRFGGYEFRPVVSFEGRCTVAVFAADGEQIRAFQQHNVFQHIGHVMQVFVGADLDSSYSRMLRSQIGLDADLAAAMVHTLGAHLHLDDSPTEVTRAPHRRRGKKPGRR